MVAVAEALDPATVVADPVNDAAKVAFVSKAVYLWTTEVKAFDAVTVAWTAGNPAAVVAEAVEFATVVIEPAGPEVLVGD